MSPVLQATFTSASRYRLYQFGTRAQQLRCFCATVPRSSHPYLVWAPDHTDDEALARRMAVRPKHFISANKYIKQGILKVAGGLITPESQDAAPADKKFVGSVLLYEADSIEDVRKLVEQDIYWTENVVSLVYKPIQLDPKYPGIETLVEQREIDNSSDADGHNTPRQSGDHTANHRRLMTWCYEVCSDRWRIKGCTGLDSRVNKFFHLNYVTTEISATGL
ncbi:hypothetical protein J3R82DRAFT_10454 [Butyriboletus roseoflavus]|nr:hypothetical protein J3R82DRAFT_10454 [Butyriboletus roseoflavus]